MTTEAHAWLPPVAILDGALARQFDGMLQTWGRRWFPTPAKLLSKAGNAAAAGPGRGAQWRTRCGRLVFALDHQRTMRLGSALLGFRKPWVKSDPRDLTLIRNMTREALGDLSSSLAPMFQSDPQIEQQPDEAKSLPTAMSVAVSGAPGKLFDLSVSWEAAVAGRKSVVPAPRAPLPLQPRHKAIAAQLVRIGAFVGSGRMELSDLRTLSPGDVLVLDRGLEDEFEVAVDGRLVALSGYEIKRNGAHLSLQTKSRTPSGGV